ncbi:MAG TPA: hypothetical protein VFN27_16930 [Xanthobacteraceae bacterium]|nr:hypothetical protein [Xanthobacteraceae bacterium]
MAEREPDRLDALLAIIRNPDAAEELADQMAELDGARDLHDKRDAELDARKDELEALNAQLKNIEGRQQVEHNRIAEHEASLATRAKIIGDREAELQGEVIAHAQEHGRRDAELNTREQAVAARENELEEKVAKYEADREALDRKIAAARAFVDAA